MFYNLPPVDVRLVVKNEVHIPLRYDWCTNYYKNVEFYAGHSGYKKNPGTWHIDIVDAYPKIFNDHVSKFVPLVIPRGTIIRIAKLALGKNSGPRHVNISITKTHNRRTEWNLPTLYFAILPEELALFDLEKHESKA